MKLIEGATYRFIGDSAAYRGRVGVLSNVRTQGRQQIGWLSNHKEWMAAGLPPQIEALSSELELLAGASVGAHLASQPEPTTDPFTGLECDLVEDIIGKLGEYGYRVCVVGQRKAKGSGTTVGYPDLSVRLPAWPRGMACLLETKTKGGTVRPEQETLRADGWSYVVRSVAEALECMKAFERELMLVGAVEMGERLFSNCPKEGKI